MNHYFTNINFTIQSLVSRFESSLENQNFSSFEEEDFLQIINHYSVEKLPHEAILTAEKGIEKFPTSKELRLTQIKLLIHNNYPNLAKTVLDKIDNPSFDGPDIDLLKVERAIELNELEKGLSILNHMKTKYHESDILSDIYVLEGLIYQNQNRYNDLFSSISKALQYTPNHEGALERILFCFELTKKHKKSIHFHQELLQKEHYSALTWYNIGHSFYQESMYKEAIEAFEFAFIIDESLEAAYYYCAEVSMLIGIYSKAIKCYHQMIERYQISNNDVFKYLGECYIKSGNPKMGLEFLELGKANDDEDPDIYHLMAEAFRLKGKYDEAIELYKKAIELDEFRDDAHVGIAICSFKKFDFYTSISHFSSAVELAPERSEHWVQFASLYLNIGEIWKAESILNKGRKNNHCAKILFCQGACLLLLEKRKIGLKWLEEAMKIDGNQQEIIFEFAPELRDNKDVIALLNFYNKG